MKSTALARWVSLIGTFFVPVAAAGRHGSRVCLAHYGVYRQLGTKIHPSDSDFPRATITAWEIKPGTSRDESDRCGPKRTRISTGKCNHTVTSRERLALKRG